MTDGVSLLLTRDGPILHFLDEQSLLFDDVRCASQLKKLSKKKIDVSTRAKLWEYFSCATLPESCAARSHFFLSLNILNSRDEHRQKEGSACSLPHFITLDYVNNHTPPVKHQN